MRLRMISGAAVAALCVAGSPALAEVHTFARQGVWDAFGGTSTNGTEVCGISSSTANRYFGMKFFKGDKTLTIQLSAKEWRIKNGAKQRVLMQIDENADWNATATGMHFDDGDAGLEFEIQSTQLAQFMEQFRDGNELDVTFPGSDVVNWKGSLDGSDTISTSFSGCIKAMEN